MRSTIRNLQPARTKPVWAAVVATLMILPGAVQAHQVCVTNASELQAALDQAAVTSDEGSFINIAKGTYKTPDLASPTRFIYQTSIVDPQFFIVVRGGWNADCTVRTAE